jgi:hypothetical protein
VYYKFSCRKKIGALLFGKFFLPSGPKKNDTSSFTKLPDTNFFKRILYYKWSCTNYTSWLFTFLLSMKCKCCSSKTMITKGDSTRIKSLILKLILKSISSTDGCYYNGQLYQQSQRWVDGCRYSCICDDAKTGRYRCSPKYVFSPQFANFTVVITIWFAYTTFHQVKCWMLNDIFHING